MLRHCNVNTVKSWSKLVVKNRPDPVFQIVDLTKDLYNDFIDFQMKYFVKKEVIHQMSGLPYSEKAMDEYKAILGPSFVNPPYHTVICCPEVEGQLLPKIVASSTVKLTQKNVLMDHESLMAQAKTSEVKKFFQIDHELYQLCPVQKIMDKYGVENATDYVSMAVHPDYANLGIATEMLSLRPKINAAINAQLSFAWATAKGSQKASAKNGWVTEFEIDAEEFTKKYNVKLGNIPTVFKFVICRS